MLILICYDIIPILNKYRSVCMHNQIQWINALKGFGIFCVTFAHLSPLYPLETYIFSFHMFLFFFISGCLYKPTTFWDFVVKKFKNILVPFIIWDFLSSFVALISGSTLQDTINKFFIIKGELCWNAPVWFLLILFITELIYAALNTIYRYKWLSMVVFLLSIVCWICFGSYILPLKLNLVPLALTFYSLGNILGKIFIEKESSNIAIFLGIIVLGFNSLFFGTIKNIRISYTAAIFGNIYYCILAGIAGTLFYTLVFRKCKFLGQNKLLCYLGKNSLIIMVTQYWFFRTYDKISMRLFQFSVWYRRGTIKALIISIITIAIIIVGVAIFKRIFKNNSKILQIAKYAGIR